MKEGEKVPKGELIGLAYSDDICTIQEINEASINKNKYSGEIRPRSVYVFTALWPILLMKNIT